jgi:cytochrome P450
MLSFITSEYLPPSTFFIALFTSYTLYYIGWIIYSRFFHPYASIPGPVFASISTWWRWYAVRYSIQDRLQYALHDKYGPIVRIGPNEISVSDPQAIDVLARPDFPKTEFYSTFNPQIGGRIEPFAEQNDKIHTQHRRIITPLFRSEVVAEWEPYVIRILAIFDERMAGFAENKTSFDLAEYVARYTWDTVGDMVYSRNGGFGMLKGTDYMGWMEMIRVMPGPMASLGYVPYGLKNLYFLSMLAFSPATRRGLVAAMTIVKQVKQLVKERKDMEARGEEFPETDMLSRMMAMTRDEKVDFNEDDIGVILNAFVWAGSDTTGSSLAMVTWYALPTRTWELTLARSCTTSFPTRRHLSASGTNCKPLSLTLRQTPPPTPCLRNFPSSLPV